MTTSIFDSCPPRHPSSIRCLERALFILVILVLAWSLLSPSPSLAAKPVFHPLTSQTLGQIRARYAGKPLVVHIWAMSCEPCLAELPRWGELVRERADLHLVLVQFDAAPREASTERLAQAGLAGVESWGVAAEPDDYLRASIDPKWIGDLPRTLLISPDGATTSIRGVANLETIRRWLDAQPHEQRAAGATLQRTP